MRLSRLQPYILSFALVLLAFPSYAHAAWPWDGINEALQNVAYFIVINGLGLLVWFAASLLDFGVNTFVIGFGNTFTSTGIGIAVDQTWVIIRDFVNMFFIFGFVYIGFKMILNSSDSNTRRWLVNILLAALLVNFSLFVTKFAIDMSNQLAAQIAVNGLTDGEKLYDDTTKLRKVDLTASFMARMGISKVYGMNFATVDGAGWGYVFGTAILFLTAAFVFAAGGILLIIRFAVLNIYMMLSPVMFMSWILPPLKDTMDRFWSQFIGKALFAPIYLMFIYFSLQVISGLQVSVGKDGNSFANPDWQGSFQAIEDGAKGGTSTSSMLGTLPFFILICVFLALSIIAADKLGMEGGSKAVSLGRSFANRVRKTAVNNSAGFALRGVNWASDKAQGGYERLDAGMSTSRTGRLLRGAATVATLGALSDKSIRSTFEAGKKLSIDSSETADDVAKRNRERTGRQSQALGEMEREGNMDNFNSAIDSTATTAQELQDAFSGLGRTIRQMSNEERNDLGYDKLTSARVAMNLSDAHIESLEKSGNFSYQQIQNIKNARTQAHVSVANGGVHPRTTDPTAANYNADMARHNVLPAGRQLANQGEMEDFQNRQRESLISRDIKAAGNMDMDVFTNADMSVHLTPQALEERIRNGGVGEAQRNTIRNNIITQVNSDLASNNPSEVARGQRQANMWNTWSNGTSGSGARFGLQFNVPQAQPAQAAGGAPNAAQQRQQNQQARQARANAARNNRNRPGP